MSRRAVDMAWGGLAAGGIALIAPWAGGGVDALGVLLALAAGTCWAAYILLGSRVSRMIPGGADTRRIADSLFRRHHGNVRDALRELYDVHAD